MTTAPQALTIGLVSFVAAAALPLAQQCASRRREARQAFTLAPFAINRVSGAVQVVGFDLVLSPHMATSAFLESTLYQHVKKSWYLTASGNVVHWLDVSFTHDRFSNVWLTLMFEHGELAAISFAWGPVITIPEWTSERVEHDAQRYRDFICRELSTTSVPCVFSWGTAYAGIDPKAGTADATLRYAGFATIAG